MANRYSPTDYLYISARIRAIENGMVGRERLNSLIELKTVNEILAALVPLGFAQAADSVGMPDIEAMLFNYLKARLGTVEESVPDNALLLPIRYPYDNHNIKSYLKATKRGVDPRDLMIDLGTIPLPELMESLRTGHYDTLPENMARAVPEALEAYAKTNDPREIDFCLDRAVFADMAAATAQLPFANHIVATKADLTNILICARLLKMNLSALAPALFAKAAVPGGTLPLSFFTPVLEDMKLPLSSLLAATPYHAVLQDSLTASEQAADNYLSNELCAAKSVPFGAEVPFAYLMALETSIKNLRLLLACKNAGLANAEIRAKVRDCYV